MLLLLLRLFNVYYMAKSFAELLREYRGDRSQAKVSEILDISATYYSELERGKKEPSYRILSQVVERSGKGLAFWLGGEGRSAPAKIAPFFGWDRGRRRYLTVPEITMMLGRVWHGIDNLPPLSVADRGIIADMLEACLRSLNKADR
ncbi:MAG: helix-turn-helix domain-containing protein [Cloacibacillus evryensis]